MKWIKVTPETMPPDNRPVIATAKFLENVVYGWKIVLHDVVWEENTKQWIDWDRPKIIEDDSFVITHWMPYPEPAED